MRRIALAFVLVAVCAVEAGDRLRVSLPAAVAQAPADVWVTIHMEPEPEDRAMRFSVVGEPGEYRSSTWVLDGANGWRIKQDWTRHLGPGCYQWYAEILDASGKPLAVAHTPEFTVLGRDGNPCATD
jgi:hypothetical protein